MKQCENCGKEFVYTGPRGKGYVAKTCGAECSLSLQKKRIISLNIERRIHDRIIKSCEVCGKEIITSDADYQRVACSKECHAKRLSSLYSGRKLSKEWIENQNLSKTKDKILKHGDYQCDKCAKKFSTNTSLRSHRSYCTPGNEKRKKCPQCEKEFSERGLKIHIKSHDEAWREKASLAIKKSIQNRQPVKSTSNVEMTFSQKLKDFFGDQLVVHKFRIEGVNHEYDFYIPHKNLIVELDGDYWHGNPAKFELTPRMRQQYRIDETWTFKAIESGFLVRRIWVSDLEKFDLKDL